MENNKRFCGDSLLVDSVVLYNVVGTIPLTTSIHTIPRDPLYLVYIRLEDNARPKAPQHNELGTYMQFAPSCFTMSSQIRLSSRIQSFAIHSSVWHALPIFDHFRESSIMNNGNTTNPGQLSNMADQSNSNDYDFLNDLDLANFDPNLVYDPTFDLSLPGLPFDESSGFANNSLFPTQQQYNDQLPFDPTYNQAAPTFAPQAAPLYHPGLGWYQPVPGPAPVPSQQQMSTFTPNGAPLVVESIEKPEPSHASTGKNKRKYGPSEYLDQQAKRRAIGDDSGPRPVSRDSVDFHVTGRKTKQKAGTASKPKKRAIGAKKPVLKAAELKNCNCPAAEAVKDAHIRRPANSFMLFRSDFSSERTTSKGEKRGTENPAISSTAGEKWQEHKAANDETYLKYIALGAEKERQHKERYPNYKYDTSVRYQAKFGRPDCTCGAYAKNSAALLKKLGMGPSINETEKERDVYVMPTTRSMSRSNSLAPAPISQTTPFQFDFNLPDGSINVPDFGLSLQSQSQAAESQWYDQQDYTNAAENTYEPPITRRASRISQQASGPFQEFSDDEQDVDGDVEMSNTAPAPRQKRRPSPITTARNASPKMSDFVNISPESDGPASRTRSKSVSVSLSFDESQFQEASTGDDLFGDGWNADEDVGENIVVATPMTGTSNVSPRNRSGLALPDRATRRRSRGSR
jgi:hypothetical protein